MCNWPLSGGIDVGDHDEVKALDLGSTTYPEPAQPQVQMHPCPYLRGPHDFAVGGAHAVCNACEKVVTLKVEVA